MPNILLAYNVIVSYYYHITDFTSNSILLTQYTTVIFTLSLFITIPSYIQYTIWYCVTLIYTVLSHLYWFIFGSWQLCRMWKENELMSFVKVLCSPEINRSMLLALLRAQSIKGNWPHTTPFKFRAGQVSAPCQRGPGVIVRWDQNWTFSAFSGGFGVGRKALMLK